MQDPNEAKYPDMPLCVEKNKPWSTYTPYTCPDCGGVLLKHEEDSIVKLKCHAGHSYTLRDLIIKQSEELKTSLCFAIRTLEQRKDLLGSIAAKYDKTGNRMFAEGYQKRVDEIDKHINNLKNVLVENLDDAEDAENMTNNI